jgi:hypothetical protein
MTYLEAIESLADDPHAWRYRQLAADDYHDPGVRDAWRLRLVDMASGRFGGRGGWSVEGGGLNSIQPITLHPPRSTNSEDSWGALIRACEDWNPGCCAHPSPYCSRFGRDVSRDDCISCLAGRGIAPR